MTTVEELFGDREEVEEEDLFRQEVITEVIEEVGIMDGTLAEEVEVGVAMEVVVDGVGGATKDQEGGETIGILRGRGIIE